MLGRIVLASGLLLAAHLAFAADKCSLSIEANDQMKYNVAEMKVPAGCAEVEVTLKHVGKMTAQVMGHDWVLAKTADAQAVATAGLSATPATDYLPAGDKRVIAHTMVVGGGQSASVKVPVSKLDKSGSYTFFCSFPGHYALMNGKFTL